MNFPIFFAYSGIFRKLIDNVGLTQEKIAERVGKERSLIATSLRLLKLPDNILKAIEDEKLTAGHGRAFLLSDDVDLQKKVARAVIKNNLSVRETERTIKREMAEIKNEAKPPKEKPVNDANVRSAETKLMRHLGTNVKISAKAGGKGGKLEIEYYSDSDLNRIYELLTK